MDGCSRFFGKTECHEMRSVLEREGDVSDIVDRLKQYENVDTDRASLGLRGDIKEAADEIDHLRRDRDDYKQLYADALRDYVLKRDEVERLRAALRDIKEIADGRMKMSGYPGNLLQDPILNIARRALDGK